MCATCLYICLITITLYNQFNTCIKPKDIAVETDVIIIHIAPNLSGNIPIMICTLPVSVFYMFFCFLIRYSMFFDHTGNPFIQTRMNEHIETIISVSQNEIGTTSDNDAVAFFGKLVYYTALCCPEII